MKATCHCLTCKKVTGGTNTINLLIPEQHFRITSGQTTQYATAHESGMQLTLFFCGTCGTPLYKVGDREELRGNIIVYAGTLDDLSEIDRAKPDQELYTKYRVRWLPVIEEAQQNMEFAIF